MSRDGSTRVPVVPFAVRLLVVVGLLVGAGPALADDTIRFRPRTIQPSVPRTAGVAALLPAGTRHLLVQLHDVPDADARADLAADGIVLHDYVSNRAYYATVPGGLGPGARSLSRIRWMGPLAPSDKLTPTLASGRGGPWARRPGGLAVRVLVFADVGPAAARELLAAHGAAIEEDALGRHGWADVVVPANALEGLAAADEVYWIAEIPPPPERTNSVSRMLTLSDEVAETPLLLDGSGVAVGIWDAGGADHTDFAARQTTVDPVAAHWHATHVTGTIGGDGTGCAAARGYAPGASLLNWDYEGDTTTEQQDGVTAHGVVLANHSWGASAGWQYDCGGGANTYYGHQPFGDYDLLARDWDGLAAANPQLLIVKSAGNDNDDVQGPGPYVEPDCVTPVVGSPPTEDCADDFHCIPTHGVAKNVITVGAIDDDRTWSPFSGTGPTDDGRLKPDLVASGRSVASTWPPDSYWSTSGTSMATPAVTGLAAQLVQLFRTRNGGSNPRAATLKALLISSAQDLGKPGPDYTFGFGNPDAVRGADMVNRGRWWEGTVSPAGQQEMPISVPAGTSRLTVTLAWADPQAAASCDPCLVNDVDLRLVGPVGGTFEPFVLDPADPAADATTGDNALDNVEQVVVTNPVAGTWTIRILGDSLPAGAQDVSVAYHLGSEAREVWCHDGPVRVDAPAVSFGAAVSFDPDDFAVGSPYTILAGQIDTYGASTFGTVQVLGDLGGLPDDGTVITEAHDGESCYQHRTAVDLPAVGVAHDEPVHLVDPDLTGAAIRTDSGPVHAHNAYANGGPWNAGSPFVDGNNWRMCLWVKAGDTLATRTHVSAFGASSAKKADVTLDWATAWEVDADGFHLYRAEDAAGPWTQVNGSLIPASGTVFDPVDYSFTDPAVATGDWWYRLEAVDRAGGVQSVGPVQVAVPGACGSLGDGPHGAVSLIVLLMVAPWLAASRRSRPARRS